MEILLGTQDRVFKRDHKANKEIHEQFSNCPDRTMCRRQLHRLEDQFLHISLLLLIEFGRSQLHRYGTPHSINRMFSPDVGSATSSRISSYPVLKLSISGSTNNVIQVTFHRPCFYEMRVVQKFLENTFGKRDAAFISSKSVHNRFHDVNIWFY
ncbi:hypothetical protein FF38_01682 [Lucilia cuprina]|uniref:Uncharacterized protein n=1 Tax=Lucilia cuprina TaxID=7375 RepID=A0A0L0CCH0_LUCCU|nr:hypothetical protein FF38_01682 [Lucilia cuprina]